MADGQKSDDGEVKRQSLCKRRSRQGSISGAVVTVVCMGGWGGAILCSGGQETLIWEGFALLAWPSRRKNSKQYKE